MSQNPALPSDPLMIRIGRAIGRAQLFGYFEALWPRLVLSASMIGLFLIVSWLGLWPVMPDPVRFALLAVLGLGLIASLVFAARTPRLDRIRARQRVEKCSGLAGHPLAALEDAPFERNNPDGSALWLAHQASMAGQIGRLSGGLPTPRTQVLDRWALRAPVLLLLVVAFFVAGPQRLERIEQAFLAPAGEPAIPVRIDLWATPPAYTGRAPRSLISAGDPSLPLAETAITLPVGSALTLRASDASGLAAQLEPMDGSAPIHLEGEEHSAGTTLETQLDGDGVLVITIGRDRLTLPLITIADSPPQIEFAQAVEANLAGAMLLAYTASDDYGLTGAHGEMAPADERFADAVHVVEPPRLALTLPASRSGGLVETSRDLSAHPWAGLAVDLTLIARDGAGQEGSSASQTLILPQRAFGQPLARALVEQRALLAVDRRSRVEVLTALEGLALGADSFMQEELADPLASYLALVVTTQRLRLARQGEEGDEDLRSVIDLLWQLALQIEDGDLSQAAERLRAAEEALSQGLEEGASEEEISALMDELRAALEAYMQALAEQLQNGQMEAMPPNMPLQSVDPQAMADMMDRIEELAQMGADEAARQMLEELRRQLDALRGAQAQAPQMSEEQRAAQQAMREAIQELQAITREQQRLLDETFPFSSEAQRPRLQEPDPFGLAPLDPAPRERQPGDPNAQQQPSPQGQNGQTANRDQSSPDPLDELSAQQQALREQLEALMQQLADMGLDPSALGEAGEAMQGATSMLDRGSATNAVPEQGRALDALQQGAQDMAQQMQGEGEGEGDGQAQGQGTPRLMFGPAQGQRGTDPLGRPQRASPSQDDGRVQIPRESDMQRARDILNEIQRRLGERQRPSAERDYLDRLIERF